jgi:glucan phosphoethanolaminetransferase (alkaline phosphatase superfamily)
VSQILESREAVDRPRGVLVVATLLLITASWLSYLVPIAIHNFDDTFRALGLNLPPPTRFLMTMPHAWLVFVVLAVPLFLWVMARSRLPPEELRRMKLAVRVMIVVMLLACGLAAWAFFIPMFRHAAVV